MVEGALVGAGGEGGRDGLVGNQRKGVRLFSHIMSSVLPSLWHLRSG